METAPTEIVRAELAQTYASYAGALEAREASALAAHYSDDAVILVPGSDLIAGSEAVRAYCEGLCALPYRFRLSGFSLEHLLLDGDYAIEVSRYSTISTTLERGLERVARSKALLVWRRMQGRWAIVREMYSEVR
jgi:uncharacterized protein (TIGR02246 family)